MKCLCARIQGQKKVCKTFSHMKLENKLIIISKKIFIDK